MNRAKFLIQFGLAFTLLYAGIDSFWHTNDWLGFVPQWVENFGTPIRLALHMHAVVEIILGLWLLSGWRLRWAGLLAALDMLVIIGIGGLSREMFLITFRDVGLVFMGIFLAVDRE
jgi:uncharacterized membrane protein YphA (DoxX/SURF4 family)